MVSAPFPEKRSAPRAATDFVVELYETDGRALIGIARLLNLSVSGACVESTNALAEKTTVTIRLMLGKRHLMTLPADVVWVKPVAALRQYGLRFGAYTEAARNLILKFVQEYFSEQETDFLSGPPAASPAKKP